MKGFTLVEVLVSVFILALLVAGIYEVLIVGNIIFREDISLVELQQQVRQAMGAMVKEIRESKASEITITDGNSKITFNVPPEVYGDPWVGPISYYRDIADTNSDGITDQIIREYAGTGKILAIDITALSFSLTGNTVEIQVAAQKNAGLRQWCFPTPCQTPQKTSKETVRLRNE